MVPQVRPQGATLKEEPQVEVFKEQESYVKLSNSYVRFMSERTHHSDSFFTKW